MPLVLLLLLGRNGLLRILGLALLAGLIIPLGIDLTHPLVPVGTAPAWVERLWPRYWTEIAAFVIGVVLVVSIEWHFHAS